MRLFTLIGSTMLGIGFTITTYSWLALPESAALGISAISLSITCGIGFAFLKHRKGSKQILLKNIDGDQK